LLRVTWSLPSGRRTVPKTPLRPAILLGTCFADFTTSGGQAFAHAVTQRTLPPAPFSTCQ
jgi:hypothetical protein